MNLHELLTAYKQNRRPCARNRLSEHLLPRLQRHFRIERRPDDLATGTVYMICETIDSYDGTGWRWVRNRADCWLPLCP